MARKSKEQIQEELEIPELTPEQKKNQAKILNGLGKSVLSEKELKRLRRIDKNATIEDYKVNLPDMWKLRW